MVQIMINYRYLAGKTFRRKKEQETLQYLSYHDLLTNLYNRNRLIRTLEASRARIYHAAAAAYLDVNDLKWINDTLGHAAGDELLKKTGMLLAELFPQMAYRVGGDEFVILAWEMDECLFFDKLRQLQRNMERSRISVSVGAVWLEKGTDLQALLEAADRSMYEMKRKYHQNKEQIHGTITRYSDRRG